MTQETRAGCIAMVATLVLAGSVVVLWYASEHLF